MRAYHYVTAMNMNRSQTRETTIARKGGGNFARWQQHITDWHRNLYGDIGPAPAVNADELLVLCARKNAVR